MTFDLTFIDLHAFLDIQWGSEYQLNFQIYANPVNFVFVWVPVIRDKVVKVQEPLPNRLLLNQPHLKGKCTLCAHFCLGFLAEPWSLNRQIFATILKPNAI